ncbi:MAG TPA: DNA-3-methyladenine glycosylase [Patescibacteria group bacterium]|nr:DNA-3-methyladenine glycosylase [Patescibacteria group bacterium]
MLIDDKSAAVAASYLRTHDPILASVIDAAGPCTVRPHRNYYQELVESIIGQQLSVKAARTIKKRFCELFGGEDTPSPAAILTKNVDELRTAGLSRGKATYVRDLAQHVVDGKVRFDDLDDLSNEEVITKLTAVKGVGEWTAHMFLMFCMGRMDVLAYGDLGIKNGIQKLYGLDHQPSAQEVIALAESKKWHPYESIACWYVWHSLDNVPAVPAS